MANQNFGMETRNPDIEIRMVLVQVDRRIHNRSVRHNNAYAWFCDECGDLPIASQEARLKKMCGVVLKERVVRERRRERCAMHSHPMNQTAPQPQSLPQRSKGLHWRVPSGKGFAFVGRRLKSTAHLHQAPRSDPPAQPWQQPYCACGHEALSKYYEHENRWYACLGTVCQPTSSS